MSDEGWRFLGGSAPVREILASVTRLLPALGPGRRAPPILLQGETGTGKGLLARTIHTSGPRAAGPFVELNCAAIPATLIEAELFGFERGAFTDARQTRTGLVAAAHGGTLFLDEIGLMPEGLQAKLLTVLEAREVRPLGATRARAVDVSIIAATNSDLQQAVRERRFREDLYHRLAVFVFSLPPLRERGDDVRELAEAFLARACADYGLKKTLGHDARAAIAAYRWPGNVRELANRMERVALLTEGATVTAADLALPANSTASAANDRELRDALPLKTSVDTFTRARVEQALNEAHGNISAAAERLGVPRSTLRYQLERFGVTQGGMGRARRRTAPVPPLSERVLTRAPVEGERRQVSVLFADFREAMDRVAGGDPEATRRLFDPVLDTMIGAIHGQDGSVNQVRDDGLMALFGAPVAHEDHAVRACYAALSMHERVGHLAPGMRSRLGADLTVRIGVHSGDVALRVVSGEVRLDYGAIPDTTHVATRLQQAARVGTTLITAETLRLAEGFIEVAPVALPGAYELRAPSVVRSRLGAAITRTLSPFVGRDAEITHIGAALDRARSGRGQVVALVGEAGVGKSRLVYEFTHSDRAQDWLVLETAALSYGTAISYLPIVGLLRAYFKIAERDTLGEIREKVTGTLLTLDRTLEPFLPAMLTLLDVPVDDDQWQRLDLSQRRERILEAIKHLLVVESRNQPVLVVFEDLHWIDAETQAFLDRLVEVLPTTRVLLIVSHRLESEHRWAPKTYYTSLRIDPLGADSAAELLQTVLGSDPSLHEFRRILIERTEGNPFFLEESVRTLAETQVIVGERGSYRLAKPMAEIRVPSTVQAILGARIDRLSPEDKRLLQSASVIGKDVPFVLLQAIAGAGPDELHQSLRRLQATEFLYEARLFPALEYTFRHALTHVVAYDSLLPERRRALHGQVLYELERLYSDRMTERVETLGYHALRGELWEKAVSYLRLAAHKAHDRWALGEAIVHTQQALDALERLPAGRARDIDAIELRLELSSYYYVRGNVVQSTATLQEAERLAEDSGATEQLARIVLRKGENFRLAGDFVQAVGCFERARMLAPAGNGPLSAGVSHHLGMALHGVGRYTESVDALRAAEAEPRAFALGRPTSGSPEAGRVANASWIVRSLAVLGRFDEAIREGEQMLAAAERLNSTLAMVAATLGLGEAYRERGDWARAIRLLERSVADAREGGLGVITAGVGSRLGAAYAHAGRLDEAIELLRASASVGSRALNTRSSAFARLLGEACLLSGNVDEARLQATTALEGAQALRQRGDEAAARWLLGLTTPSLVEAEVFIGEALSLASELAMRPLVAHCHLGLGNLYRRTGTREQATEHLTTATTMYCEMGMTYWLARTEAESKP